MIAHAYVTNMPQKDQLIFAPFIVTYSCWPGFELEKSDKNFAKCVDQRVAVNADDIYFQATADWTGYNEIGRAHV